MPETVVALDMIQSLALAAVLLFLGYGVRARVPFLNRYNIPAPVIGGFLFAAAALGLRLGEVLRFTFDTTLQAPLMIAFFTTIGLGASLGLLKKGGPQVVLFWALASALAIVQNLVGLAAAAGLGVHPALGLLAGSITMTGGHGTGAAFGPLVEQQHGVPGALALAMGAATFGLVAGGLIGGPIATGLIRRYGLTPAAAPALVPPAAEGPAPAASPSEVLGGEAASSYGLLKTIAIILVAMALGSLLSRFLGQFTTLPAYIGAMLVAAAIRNLADASRLIALDQRIIDDLGTIALSLFLAMALMSLNLIELLALALPMLAILALQVAVLAGFAWFVTFRVMGRDYDAAVMAGGHCGFGLGATPNAVANMESIVEKFGAAPRAFLVVPMVGAFFIDFTNAVIITTFLGVVR
ncbi:MAG: sodium/glutamate symporter [Vicinamibacterales bacterium]|nr:sodium/glutamate symporter [Vicinamibacterales bacterium]